MKSTESVGYLQGEDKPKPKRQRRAKSAPSELPAVEGTEGHPEVDPEAAAEPVKKKRRPKGPDPDAFSALLLLVGAALRYITLSLL